MEFHLLGPLEVVDESGQQLEVRGKGLRTLLVLLAMRANEVVSADHLIEVLWSETQPKDPRGALQILVSRLRKLVGSVLITRDAGYVLRLSPDDLDIAVFERLVGEGRRAFAAGRPGEAGERLREGLRLWRRGGLADVGGMASEVGLMAGWEESRRSAEDLLMESELAEGRHGEALVELERLVEEEPFREHRWWLLMLALYRSGRQADALAVYKRLGSVLGEELGIEPSTELQHLEEQILLQDTDLEWTDVLLRSTEAHPNLTFVVLWWPESQAPPAASSIPPDAIFRSEAGRIWAAFTDPPAALHVGLEIAMLGGAVGIHVGPATQTESGYIGLEVNKAGRIAATAVPGVVVLSAAMAEMVNDALVPEVDLVPLGRVELPGVTEAEVLHAAVPHTSEAPTPAVAVLRHRASNLPRQITTFVGRAAELSHIIDLLARNRLVTLTGPGGVGKTRLALQAAADRLAWHRDGAWFVELADVKGSDLVPVAIARSLDVEVSSGHPIDDIVAHLAERSLLLVLDNCEHVIDAAADAVLRLLNLVPDIAVLTTSRERLGVPGEAAWTVPAMGLPDPNAPVIDDLSASDSVALFIERVKSAQPDYRFEEGDLRAAAALCRRLDGIPLAIELAAGRVALLSPREILDGLSRRFDLLFSSDRMVHSRHKTMTAVIDWSFRLLEDDEQALLSRLSAFQAPATFEAVLAICAGDDKSTDSIVALLESLIDKSLVDADHTKEPRRFGLLPTVRQFARDELEERAETDTIAGRHAGYFAGLATRSSVDTSGSEDVWIDGVRLDMANYLAAIEWSLTQEAPLIGYEIARSLGSVWIAAGQLLDLHTITEKLLGHAGTVPDELIADVAVLAGQTAWRMGRLAEASSRAIQALELSAHSGGARRTEARALTLLGSVVDESGDPDAARRHLEQAVRLARAEADDAILANALSNLGSVEFRVGRRVEAERYYREALSVAVRVGSRREEGWALVNLGEVISEHDAPAGLAMLSDAAAVAREIGDRLLEAAALCFLGWSSRGSVGHEYARDQIASALRMFEEFGDTWGMLMCVGRLGVLQAEERSWVEGTLLLFAEERLREAEGLGPSDDSDVLASTRADLRQHLTQGEFESLADRAESLSLRDVIAIATGESAAVEVSSA